jgi:hypothetical protein
MIKVELTPEDLQRKEVYDAFFNLLNALSSIESSTKYSKKPFKKPQVSMISYKQISDQLPLEIKQYESIIKQPKCLTFLKIVFDHQKIESDRVIEELQKYYGDITSKSIGGITGAITRWFEQGQQRIPYQSEKNKDDGTHWFIWKS